MRRFKLFWPLLILCPLLFSSIVNAQELEQQITDDDVNRVSRELYCPICENTPLDVCETQACEDWRQLIREKLESGQSNQDIIEYFAEIYGERARATPTTRGFSLLVWIAPVIGAAIGVVFFTRLLRRWLARGSAPQSTLVASPTLPLGDLDDGEAEIDEYRARLEREIRESP